MRTRGLCLALVATMTGACSAGTAPSWSYALPATTTPGTASPVAVAVPTSPAPSLPDTAGGAPVHAAAVALSEFKIALGAQSLLAGDDTFTVTNKGTIGHEFVIKRTDLVDNVLPRSADGTVDEEAPELGDTGEVEVPDVGATKTLTVHLAPGHYVFFCNIAGHYAGGMHGSFTVAAGASVPRRTANGSGRTSA